MWKQDQQNHKMQHTVASNLQAGMPSHVRCFVCVMSNGPVHVLRISCRADTKKNNKDLNMIGANNIHMKFNNWRSILDFVSKVLHGKALYASEICGTGALRSSFAQGRGVKLLEMTPRLEPVGGPAHEAPGTTVIKHGRRHRDAPLVCPCPPVYLFRGR